MIIGELNVQKKNTKNKWLIQKKNNNNNHVFWKYINYDNEDSLFMKNNKVTVNAAAIMPLKDFLKSIKTSGVNIYVISKMLADLSAQLNNLDIHQKTLLYLEISNIMVIVYDDDYFKENNVDTSDIKFIYASTESVVNIDKSLDDSVIVNIPYLKNQYLSPELHNLYTLPGYIHKSCCYYSLVLISIVMIVDHRLIDLPPGKNIFKNPLTKNILLEHIKEIKPTKLYHLIERAVDNDPKKRTFLFV